MLRTYRPFTPVFAGLFLSLLTVGASLGTLPFYVDQRLHGGRLAVGVVVAAIAVTSILARPTAGRLGDRHGYKRVMLAGALFCALAGAGYLAVDRLPALPGPPVAALVAVRLLHGVGEATVCTGGVAWLVSLSPPQRRGRIVGLYGVYMWLGITVGSAVGTLLMRGYGFTAAWLFCVAAPLAGLVVVAVKRRPAQQAAAGRAALFPRVVWLPGTAMALGGLGYAALAGFGALYLDGRGIANGIAVFEAFGLTYIGVRLLLGNLPDRLGGARVALWSALVEAVGLALVAYAPNLAVALAGGVVMGAGLSLLFPALALLVIRRTPAARQGGALGAFTSFWDLGLAAGPPLTGVVANRASYPVAFLVMAGAAVLSALLALVHGRRHPAAAPATAEVPAGVGAATRNGATKAGAVRNGVARNGVARNGAARNGAARNGAARNGAARNGAAEKGATKAGAARNGAAKNGRPAVGTAGAGTSNGKKPAAGKPSATAPAEAPAGGRKRSRKQRKRSARRRTRG